MHRIYKLNLTTMSKREHKLLLQYILKKQYMYRIQYLLNNRISNPSCFVQKGLK